MNSSRRVAAIVFTSMAVGAAPRGAETDPCQDPANIRAVKPGPATAALWQRAP